MGESELDIVNPTTPATKYQSVLKEIREMENSRRQKEAGSLGQ